jgi:mono/diheme cytochrome c family protein
MRAAVRLLIVATGMYAAAILSADDLAAGGQAPTAPRKGGNPEAAKLTNPVASTPDSIASGKRAYTRLCANCHGPAGKGDGGGAAGGTMPADLTDATWDYGSSDGEIFTVIRDGTSADMGSYAERLSQPEIWSVVNYIRTLAGK